MRTLTCLLILASFFASGLLANPDLIDEHVYGGLPSNGHILHRTAYIQDWVGQQESS